MQSGAFFHTKVLGEAALGKEVCGKLNSAAETCANHGCTNTAVDTLDTFTLVDLAEAVE